MTSLPNPFPVGMGHPVPIPDTPRRPRHLDLIAYSALTLNQGWQK